MALLFLFYVSTILLLSYKGSGIDRVSAIPDKDNRLLARQITCPANSKPCGNVCIRPLETCCPDGERGCPRNSYCFQRANSKYGCCTVGRTCRGDSDDNTVPTVENFSATANVTAHSATSTVTTLVVTDATTISISAMATLVVPVATTISSSDVATAVTTSITHAASATAVSNAGATPLPPITARNPLILLSYWLLCLSIYSLINTSFPVLLSC